MFLELPIPTSLRQKRGLLIVRREQSEGSYGYVMLALRLND